MCRYTYIDITLLIIDKVFKSWQVCDCLAKWLIMLGFIDLRQSRVVRCSNVDPVYFVAGVAYPKSHDYL